MGMFYLLMWTDVSMGMMGIVLKKKRQLFKREKMAFIIHIDVQNDKIWVQDKRYKLLIK